MVFCIIWKAPLLFWKLLTFTAYFYWAFHQNHIFWHLIDYLDCFFCLWIQQVISIWINSDYILCIRSCIRIINTLFTQRGICYFLRRFRSIGSSIFKFQRCSIGKFFTCIFQKEILICYFGDNFNLNTSIRISLCIFYKIHHINLYLVWINCILIHRNRCTSCLRLRTTISNFSTDKFKSVRQCLCDCSTSLHVTVFIQVKIPCQLLIRSIIFSRFLFKICLFIICYFSLTSVQYIFTIIDSSCIRKCPVLVRL